MEKRVVKIEYSLYKKSSFLNINNVNRESYATAEIFMNTPLTPNQVKQKNTEYFQQIDFNLI